ncbi:MAG: alkaline phosphatase family protein [Ignavibacteriota bacterium]
MRTRRLLPLLLLAPALFAQTEHVVLITIDGGAAFHLENPDLALPNIRALIHQGVWADSSESGFPSVTYPNHTTLITGMTPRKHGVLANDLPLKDGKMISAHRYRGRKPS